MATSQPSLRFGVIGINHPHIYGQVDLLLRAGAELVSVYAPEAELLAQFGSKYPQAKVAGSMAELLEDETLRLIVSAAIPAQRSAIGVAALRHGKDYMSDKPGFTTLEQLAEARSVQAETGGIWSICYSERFENRATVRAGELVKAGAIGRVVQTIGLGPHRISLNTRPPWFWEHDSYGGILCDIGSHQADQFLYFTGSTTAEVIAAQVANVNHPEQPGLQDWGDMVLRGDGGSGYVRVDWFTPDGLPTWGDGRLTVLGTEGYIELRKYVDIAGRPGGNHLFLVDGRETRYISCDDVELPYGSQLIHDINNRSETAMTQEHCFLASELVLRAQQHAETAGRSDA